AARQTAGSGKADRRPDEPDGTGHNTQPAGRGDSDREHWSHRGAGNQKQHQYCRPVGRQKHPAERNDL
ncbi:hypothetical protein WFQ07_21140, partial [Yersinia enterocolitica]